MKNSKMFDDLIKDYKYKQIGSFKVPYLEQGTGPTLFMLPPWSNPAVSYALSLKTLRKHFHIIAPDYPWWSNLTQTNIEPTYTNFTQLTADFINSFAISKYNVLGYSLSVSFIISAMLQKQITPKKTIFLSSMIDYKDIENSYKLQSQAKFFSKAINYEKFLSVPIKTFVFTIYLKDLISSPIRKDKLKRSLYTTLLKQIKIASIKNAYLPAITGPKMLNLENINFANKPLIIYNENEQTYYQNGSKRLASQLNIKPKTVKAWSHRHFAFEPEQSIPYIINYLNN